MRELDLGVPGVRVNIQDYFVASMARMAMRRWFLKRREKGTLIMSIGTFPEKLIIKARRLSSGTDGKMQAIITARSHDGSNRVWITGPFSPLSSDTLN